MSKIIRVFACLFTLFFVGSAYAAGYTCNDLKKYTSCASGYYMTKGGTYNATPQVGNACTACTSGCTCAGGTAAPVCGTTCAAGTYWNGSACATCTNGYYCPGFSNVQSPATNYGRNACPTASTSTEAASSAYPDVFYPYKSISGSVDKTTTPTRTLFKNQAFGTGWATINDCKASYKFSGAGGFVYSDGVRYNSSTGKYDNFSGADIYYDSANAGYYLYTKYSDTYCNTSTNKMLYRKVVYCPGGSYCSGGSVPQCSTGTHNNEWGRTTCPGTSATSTVSTWHSAFISSGETARATKVGDCLAFDMSFTNVNGGTGTRRCYYTSGSGTTATYSTNCHYYKYTSCNAGYYMTYNGSANSTSQINNACTACAAGTYKSAAGTGTCTACAIGSYSASGASKCTACTGGKTTTATGQSSCNATCTNATGASTWTAASWSANSVTNKCAINACATGYTRGGTASSTGTSSYTCSANCNAVTLNATTNGGSANTTVYKRTGSTTWYSNNTCSTSITSITKPTKTNATYAGHYNTSSNSGGTQCVTAAGALSTSTSCNVTGSKTFYARYNCNTGYTASGTTIAGTCAANCIAVTLNNTQNGGTGGTATLYKRVGSTTIYSDNTCSTALTLSKPTKTNATYAGHYNTTATSGGTQCVTSAGAWNSSFNPTGATTCYARYNCNTGWTASGTTIAGACGATCNAITMNATQNGGSGTATTLYKKSGSTTWYSNNTCSTTITTLSSRPTKTNAAYAGHYTTTAASGGTQCVTAAGALSTSTLCNVTGATTFYPQFTCNTGWTNAGTRIAGTCTATTNTITLNKNGGTGTCGGQSSTTNGSTTCTTGSAKSLPTWDSSTCNITNGNKIFKGWSTSSSATSGSTSITCPTVATTYYAVWTTPTCSATNGTCVITTPSGNAPRATITCNTGYSQSGGTNRTTSFTVTGSAGGTSVSGTCYAVTSTVSFNLNGGSGNQPNNVTATYGSNMPALSTSANPSRTGYTFGGWYDTSAATGGTQYYNTSRGSAHTWDKTDANVTLYARWTANSFTVVYNLNNGTGTKPANKTCTYNEACTLDAGTGTGYYRGGYVLKGWSASSSATSGSFDGKNLAASGTVNVYAVWSPCGAGTAKAAGTAAATACTTCAAGTYTDTTGQISCASCGVGYYCTGGSNHTECSSLTGVSVSGGSYTSVSPYNASTTCRYTAPTKTITGCSAVTSSTVAYSGTAWPATTYNVTASGGYVIANNGSASATCTQCTGATFSAGGSATSCTACPAQTSGWTRNSGNGWSAVTQCNQTKAVGGNCSAGTLRQNATSTTAWGSTVIHSALEAKAGYIVNGQSCTGCSAGTYSAGGTATACSNCTGRTKYSGANAASCSDVGTGYYTTGCNTSGNNCTGRTQCSGSTYCVSGVQNNCPAAESTWTLGTGTGWSAVTSCFETKAATAVSTYCSEGQLKKNATNTTTWGAATISSAFKAKAGSIVSGQTCTQCTGATYSAGGTATECAACPTGYASNTTAGKTAIGQCQASCAAGYAVQTANEACKIVASGYQTGTHTVSYGSKTPTAADSTSPAVGTWYSCLTNYSASGTAAADHDARSDCKISCGAGTRIASVNATSCTTPSGNWYVGAHSVAAGSTSSVSSCLTNYTIGGTAATDHDAASDCKISCGGGAYIAKANDTSCTNVGAGYWAAASTVSQGVASSRTACASGLTTIGYGAGADEAGDCGRIMHVGDSKVYLRSTKKTTPSLNVKIGDSTFYGNMSTATKGTLRVKKDTTTYSVHDDSM